MPPDALTYKSAKALGDNGFELDDVVFTPPPDATAGSKAEPIKVQEHHRRRGRFRPIAKQAPPNFLQACGSRASRSSNKPAEGIDLKALAGIDKVSVDFQFDYRIDPAKKTLTVNRIEINLNGLARLEVSMVLDNITLDTATQPDKAMNDTTLRTASLVYDDHSLLAKALPAAAKSSMQTDDPAGDDRAGQDLPRRAAHRPGRRRRKRRSTRSNPTCRGLQGAKGSAAPDLQPARQDHRRGDHQRRTAPTT